MGQSVCMECKQRERARCLELLMEHQTISKRLAFPYIKFQLPKWMPNQIANPHLIPKRKH